VNIQKQPDPRDLRYLKLITGRLRDRSEEEIAADTKCESPAALYQQLTRDGFPICRVCGSTFVEQDHCEKAIGQEGKKRRARTKGVVQELPPAAAATNLFRDALHRFDEDISLLTHRRDYLQGGRFVAKHVLSGERGEAWQTHFRDGLPDEAWREYCEAYGGDPSRDQFDVPVDSVKPAGVSQAPPEPLTRLIAMYALSDFPMDLLLAKLHPNPEAVSPEFVRQLERHTENEKVGLEKAARTVARLVRGGAVKPGPPSGELSPTEEDAKAYIKERRGEGVADKQILEELRAGYGFRRPVRFGAAGEGHAWPDITMADVRRLGKLS
jgi:hypothetical protein